MDTTKKLLPIWPDVGQTLDLSRKSVYELANSDGFPIVKIGRRKLVPVDALQRWIEENTVTACKSK